MDVSGLFQRAHFRDEEAQRTMQRAGVIYGVLYGLCFALVIWGPDALILSHSHAEMAWAKLAIGLPATLFITTVVGFWSGRSGRASIWIVLWISCAALIGIFAGAAPSTGLNLISWISEPRVRWIHTYPLGSAGRARMWFFTAIHAALGAWVGLLGRWVTERAWNLTPATGNLNPRTVTVLLWCIPLAIGAGSAGDDLINKDLRAGPVAVHSLIAGDSSPASFERLGGQPSDRYVLHLVQHDLEGQYNTTVDAAFDNGFVARCTVFGSSVAGCQAISPQLEAWMNAIIQEILRGNPGTLIAEYTGRLSIRPEVLRELATQRTLLSEHYAIRKETQRAGVVVMSAEFTEQRVLTCRFRGAAPVVLDDCQIH